MALSLDEALGMSLADEADESIHVDVNTRQITVPESQKLFGVESDADVEVKHIVIDGRYADGTDLSGFTFRVNYQNANGDKGTYFVTDVTTNDDSLEFDWVIGRNVVAYKGTIAFIVCAYTINSDSVIQNEWNSTLGRGTVLEGLEVSEFDFGDDIVRQLAGILSDVNAAQASAKASASAAAQSEENSAKNATAAANAKSVAESKASSASDSATAAAKSEANAKASASAAAQSEENSAKNATAAANAKSVAESKASSASDSATAAAKSEANAKASASAAAQSVGAVYYGVDFTGSTSAGTRTGGAKNFVFRPGTDSDAGENSFDGVYPWKGMKRCCCSIGSDGEITVNAYKGQPEYTEDGSNGEIFVEIPRFYVAGAWDTDPKVSATPLPGFRVPKKFQKLDGTLRTKNYIRAFSGSIGSDNKLHSLPNVVPTGNKTISQFTAAARLWASNVSIGTSEDAEVLIYLMIVVYGTRNFQEKIRGVSNLYSTNIAITGGRTNEAAVTVAKNILEPGMIISIGTGSENESVAYRRIITSVDAIDGDTANVKVAFSGEPVTTNTSQKVWLIMQSTGTTENVKSTCGSPVSNTDGRHSFVFYGIENPLYGNQWRFEGDWKLVDGVAYYCEDPSKYNWSTVDDYIKLSDIAFPGEGWVTALQSDERAPHLQVTKSVGGSSGTYMGDYFWINKSDVRVVLRGGYSGVGDRVGPFSLALSDGVGSSWWGGGADLSVPG